MSRIHSRWLRRGPTDREVLARLPAVTHPGYLPVGGVVEELTDSDLVVMVGVKHYRLRTGLLAQRDGRVVATADYLKEKGLL